MGCELIHTVKPDRFFPRPR